MITSKVKSLKECSDKELARLYQLTLDVPDSGMRGSLKFPHKTDNVILAYKNSNIVGWVLFNGVVRTNFVAKKIVNVSIFVDPDFRKHGIAKNLLEKLTFECNLRYRGYTLYVYPDTWAATNLFGKYLPTALAQI